MRYAIIKNNKINSWSFGSDLSNKIGNEQALILPVSDDMLIGAIKDVIKDMKKAKEIEEREIDFLCSIDDTSDDIDRLTLDDIKDIL